MMDNDEGTQIPHTSPFEVIRMEAEDGSEYWSARDLAKILDYALWQKFRNVIEKAKKACANSGQNISDHFIQTDKMVTLGSKAQRKIEDYFLSRYACYLVVQNADPSKEIVALGQTYFAVQTRRQEEADALAGLSEDQRRLLARSQLTINNVQLAETASQAGVVTTKDFAIFQDHGYMGLYNGLRAADIHYRKGLKKNQKILDYMNSSELAANMFRATQTEEKIRREGIKDKAEANDAHRRMGQRVRQFIKEEGGTMPEDQQTPTRSVQQVQRDEQKRLKHSEQQPTLFALEE